MRKSFQFEANEWDRVIIARLYKHYENILWAHKIKLRPAVIRLMESNIHWGRWDLENRTIWISRKLIREGSWFNVESILRHEMAHQYCSEFYTASGQRPHGELFQMACERLGVPVHFRKSAASMQEVPLNWKTQSLDEESEKLFNRVQKLLALATSSNEHEALLAMAKVREIYAKYNLDKYFAGGRAPLRKNEVNSTFVPSSHEHMAHVCICHNKKRIEAHQDKIAGILVSHFFVKVIFTRTFDPESLQEYKAIELIGTRENVLMAEYVYYFLLQQTDYLVRELKKRKPGLSRFEAKSYRLGVLQGFSEKLIQMDQHKKNVSFASNQEDFNFGKALALIESDQNLKNYVASIFPRLVNASSHTQYIDSNIYSEGKVAGERINLHRAVSEKKGNSGLLLS